MPIDNEIKGRLALITGASGGIGAACARDLWSHGTSLAITYSSNKTSIDELYDELQVTSDGRRLTVHQADVTHDADLKRLFEEVHRDHGQGPDILIVNAGYGKRASNILDIEIEEWDYTINVNLRASFVITKLAVPHMLQQHWGRVVYISSIAAGGTSINGCHYSASKAGVQGLSKNLASKMGKDGITFNDVAPAMITGTGMIPDEEQLKGTPGDVKNIPVGRSGSTQECANVVTMLCRTGYMTGQSLLLSGGLNSARPRDFLEAMKCGYGSSDCRIGIAALKAGDVSAAYISSNKDPGHDPPCLCNWSQ
nr:3-oxoacyl-[acyl-carrier-protein] reductase fabg [Quercus suber]